MNPAPNSFTAGMPTARKNSVEIIVLGSTEFKIDGSLDSTGLAMIKQNDQKILISNGFCSEATELLSLKKSTEIEVCSFSHYDSRGPSRLTFSSKWYESPFLD